VTHAAQKVSSCLRLPLLQHQLRLMALSPSWTNYLCGVGGELQLQCGYAIEVEDDQNSNACRASSSMGEEKSQ